MIDRRSVAAALAMALLSRSVEGSAGARSSGKYVAKLRALESAARGRLGAFVLDTQSGVTYGWRENERFAHCSSFKLSLAAMVLSMADRNEVDLAELLRWTPEEMLPVSPVTATSITRGLSIEALARATMVTSDNTAANVLLRKFGGPLALTSFWRSLGDDVSRLDRLEPELNEVPPGTTLDTTTPAAMARTAAKLIHGDALLPASQARLKNWMAEVRTGSQRIRAGIPSAWESGDKTGTGIGERTHTYVDIAYAGPVGRAPLIITAYFEPARRVEPMDPVALGVLADVGRLAAASLSERR